MGQLTPGEIVDEALKTGRITEGRSRLDEWQALQDVSLETLSNLRYYRPLLGQIDAAIEAAKQMIALRPADSCECKSDHLSLGRLHLAANKLDLAWEALRVVLNWNEFRDHYDVGMVRYAVELALDISAASSRESKLCDQAFNAAVTTLNDGCSTRRRKRRRSLSADGRWMGVYC